MEKQKCGGCKAVLCEKKFMNCAACNQKYDLQCANLSPKRYRALNDENKRKWKCLECISKLPKLDNTDTPVRSGPSTSLKPVATAETGDKSVQPDVGVTLRRKPSPTPPLASLNANYITEDRMKEMLNANGRDLRAVVESCVNGLSERLDSMKTQCSGYQESLSFVSRQYDELRKELADFKNLFGSVNSELRNIRDENKSLKETLNLQSARIKKLEEENLRQQQWSRMQNIEVTGIPENKEENTTDIVLKVAQHIGVPIEPSDVEFAHRVQPRQAGAAGSSRSLIVRLRQRDVKDSIVAAARKHRNLNAKELGLGGEAMRVFVNEHLTRENKMLLSACKIRAREANFKFVWTKNCRIYARRSEITPPIPISSSYDLPKIV